MPSDAQLTPADAARRHLRWGWWSLLAFLTLGFTLEMLHGFKVGLYLDAANETRRLMWRLAHAHGALLAIIHILFALHLRTAPEAAPSRLAVASLSLCAAGILLPGGFFLAGVTVYAGDPGLAILAVPAGAALLAVAVYATARASAAAGRGTAVKPDTSRRSRS